MTKSETGKLLAIVAATYQNFTVNEFKQNVWFELLQDINYKHAQTALMETLRTSKYPPTPAEIIEKAKIELLIESRMEGKLIDYSGNSIAIEQDPRSIYKG